MDLAGNAGIDVSVSVRSPLNIRPRELFGMSMMNWAILQRAAAIPADGCAQHAAAAAGHWRPRETGLAQIAERPLAQIIEDRKIPVLDIGTVDLIRQGKIKILAASSAAKECRSNSPTARASRSTPSSKRPVTGPTCGHCCPTTSMRWTHPSVQRPAVGRRICRAVLLWTYPLPPGSCARSHRGAPDRVADTDCGSDALPKPYSMPIYPSAADCRRGTSSRYDERFPRTEAVFDLIDGVPTTNVPAAHMSWERREAGWPAFLLPGIGRRSALEIPPITTNSPSL